MSKPFGVISIYTTPDSMAMKVEEYFEHCFVTKVDKTTGLEKQFEIHPPTMSGLARYLGFSSRFQMLNYKNDENELYEDVINDAKLRIEDYLEQKLIYSKAPAGIIFALKNNAGWEDARKQQITGDTDKPLVFGWATNAADVLDEQKKEGALPAPTPQIESTVDAEVVSSGYSD